MQAARWARAQLYAHQAVCGLEVVKGQAAERGRVLGIEKDEQAGRDDAVVVLQQSFACNPWYTMRCMVNLENRTGLAIDLDQTLTVQEALRGFTIDAAYGRGMEAGRSSLEPASGPISPW